MKTWRPIVATAVVAAAAWLAYAPILGAYFRHDDFWWLSVAAQWADGSLSLTRAPAGVAPLYSLLYSFLYHTWGLNPQPYFAVLLLCHVLDSCLVLALVWLLTRRLLAGFTAGLLFALLSCHHEAVTWPAGGPHVFALLSILLALIMWTLYRQGRAWCLPLAVACALAAAFTKDSGIAVVPLLLALDVCAFRGRRRWALATLALPLVALVAWRAVFPPIAEPQRPGSTSFHLGPHSVLNMITNPPQMLVPDLRFENYQQFLARLLPAGAVHAAIVGSQVGLWLLSALALWAVLRGTRPVKLGVLWCYAGYLPFIPFSYDYARAPRYLYIPSVGLALLAGVAAVAVSARVRSRLGRAAIMALFVAYLAGSFGFARLVCANRLEESRQRLAAMAAVQAHVPHPPPRAEIVLEGLPEYLHDVGQGLALRYGRPLHIRVGAVAAGPQVYRFSFDPAVPGQLVEFRPPVSP